MSFHPFSISYATAGDATALLAKAPRSEGPAGPSSRVTSQGRAVSVDLQRGPRTPAIPRGVKPTLSHCSLGYHRSGVADAEAREVVDATGEREPAEPRQPTHKQGF